MKLMNPTDAPITLQLSLEEKFDFLPRAEHDVPNEFIERVMKGKNKATKAYLEQLVPVRSKEAKRSIAEMMAEEERAKKDDKSRIEEGGGTNPSGKPKVT